MHKDDNWNLAPGVDEEMNALFGQEEKASLSAEEMDDFLSDFLEDDGPDSHDDEPAFTEPEEEEPRTEEEPEEPAAEEPELTEPEQNDEPQRESKPKAKTKVAAGKGKKKKKTGKKTAAAEPVKKPAKGAGKKIKKKAKKKGHIGKAALIVLVVLAVMLITLCAVALYSAHVITNSQVNFPNVSIDGVYVGGMTREETVAELERSGWVDQRKGKLSIIVTDSIGCELEYEKAVLKPTAEQVADFAYAYGHGSSPVNNLIHYISNFFTPVDMGTEESEINEEYIRPKLREIVARFSEAAGTDNGCVLDDEAKELVCIKGAGQVKVTEDRLYNQVCKALRKQETEFHYDPETKDVTMPDFDLLYNKLHSVVSNAYYDKETGEIVPEEYGVTFDLSDAERMWKEAEIMDEIRVPVIYSDPEVKTEDIEALLYRDLLGETTTSFRGSTGDRINNIRLAVSKFDGMILLPGQSFSYNEVVGERTLEAGFKYAGAYSYTGVIYEVGGGICQVSSTLYDSVLLARLQVDDRTEHYFPVSYLPYGLDATVSWEGPEFVFTNNRDYPVKIVGSIDEKGNKVTIQIWGTNLDGSYCELTSGSWPVYDTTYPDVKTGIGARSMRITYDKDGNEIEKEIIAYSTYHLHDEDIKWPAGAATSPDTGGEGGAAANSDGTYG
ncbi:MAG: VanW family protein [Oscillospiraceae bacterium]|nr:VanW family protein [Oscillospiraceae bacterium]